MSAHTPGPWKWFEYPDGRKLLSGPNRAVLHCPDAPMSCEPDDARLIAAAPELLDALTADDVAQIAEGIQHFCMGPVEDDELNAIWQPYLDKLNALRAAILKATGQ